MEAATKAKDVQKSVRLSQEVYEYVESADGKSFNDKLNCVIMDAKRSEADRLERIQRYDERIEQEEAELLRCMKHKEDFMDMQRKAVHILRQLEELEGEVKKHIEECRQETHRGMQTRKMDWRNRYMSIKEVKLPDGLVLPDDLIDMVGEFVNKTNRKFELVELMGDDLPFGLTHEQYREYSSLPQELLELQRSIVFYLVGFMGYSLQGAAAPDERIRFVGGNELQKQIEERRNDKSNMDIQAHKS